MYLGTSTKHPYIFGDLFHPQSKFFINNTPEGVSGYDLVCQSLSNGLAVIESRP